MPTLDVVIDADTRGLNSGLNESERRFGAMGGIAKGAGLAVAGGLAIAGVAAVKLGVDAVGAASDLNETMNRAKVIFGASTEAIIAFGDTSAENLGLSKAAAIDAATGFGNMFSQLGQSKAEAASTSQTIVQLAADLGSFNNLETADVVDKLSGAFRGEYDSLQALIPNINAARVEKEALAATGKTLAADLTAEEKAMATLAIVQRDGAAAAGDFARTSDGLANQQKILSARFEDVKASLGEKLLPIVTDAVSGINRMFDGSSDLSNTLEKRLGPVLETQAEILGIVVEAGKEFYKWFVDEIAPGLLRFVQPQLEALVDGFDTIKEAVEENEPELRVLLKALKDTAEFIAQDVLPIIGDLIALGLDALFLSLSTIIGQVASFVGQLQGAYDAAVDLRDLLASIDWSDLLPSGNPFGGVFGRSAALPTGGKYDTAPQERQAVVINIDVKEAIDPAATARSIRRVLADADALNGSPDWGTL